MSKDYKIKDFSDIDNADGNLETFITALQRQNALPFTQRIRDEVSSIILKSGAKTILEVGCGLGEAAFQFSQISPKKKIIAIDKSDGLVKYCCERYKADNLTFTCMDINKIELPENSFDLIYIERVLHHLTDPEQSVSKLNRLLKRDGLLVLHEPDFATACISPWNDAISPMLVSSFAANVNQGDMGRRLPQICLNEKYQVIDILVDIAQFTADNVFDIVPLQQYRDELKKDFNVDNSTLSKYWQNLEDAGKHNAFFFSVNLYSVIARKNN